MKILIKNAAVINYDKEEKCDIYIVDGKIVKMREGLKEEADKVIDASGKMVLPGLIDIHCHLRDPGYEYKEDIKTGSRSAAKGGFTGIVAMPNTKPVVDNKSVVEYILNKAEKESVVHVYQAGTISKGLEGKELSENYLHQIQIILSQILRFLDGKYHCGGLEQPHTYAAVKQRPVHTPLGTDIRKLEEYLQNEAAKGDVTCLGILLTGCSGIRIGELCALKWEDIHFDTGTMHIGKTLQRIRTFQDNGEETGGSHATGTKITITSPKSSHSDREIPIPDFLLELLQRKRNQKGYLISGKKKEYTEPRTLQYRFQRILKTLGIPYFNFHMLRHIFATNCISHGFDMKTLSELLGHSNVATTMRIYVHSDMERKKMLMADYRMTA